MYRMERAEHADIGDRQAWAILDPSGDTITYVYSQDGAEGLLTHLNR